MNFILFISKINYIEFGTFCFIVDGQIFKITPLKIAHISSCDALVNEQYISDVLKYTEWTNAESHYDLAITLLSNDCFLKNMTEWIDICWTKCYVNFDIFPTVQIEMWFTVAIIDLQVMSLGNFTIKDYNTYLKFNISGMSS